MPIYSISDLYPIYEDTYDKIKPSTIDSYPEVAATIYLIMRIDGEIKNGGVAQLVWNLHEMYDYEYLYNALKRIDSSKGYEIVKKAVDYIYKTEKRKTAFFDKGPFGAAKPLQKLTDDYYNLSPSVSAQLLTYVEENWKDKDLKKLVKKLKLEDILKVSFTKEQVFDAISDANLKQVESMLATGFDVNMKDRRNKNLIAKCLGSSDKMKTRVKIVQRLVEAGALVDAVDEERGITALNAISFYGGRMEYLKCLVDLGADIEHEGVRGRTTVFNLVKKYKNLQYFIDLGANIHCKTSDGFTPLGYALSDLGRWIDDKKHAFRHEYIPELEQSIKILLQHKAKLSKTPITWFKRTELSYVTGDLALLKLLSKEASFQTIPEFTNSKGAWS